MLGCLTEVRPGRRLYVEFLYGDPGGQLAESRQAALMVHGSMAHCSQVHYPAAECSTVASTSPESEARHGMRAVR